MERNSDKFDRKKLGDENLTEFEKAAAKEGRKVI